MHIRLTAGFDFAFERVRGVLWKICVIVMIFLPDCISGTFRDKRLTSDFLIFFFCFRKFDVFLECPQAFLVFSTFVLIRLLCFVSFVKKKKVERFTNGAAGEARSAELIRPLL